MKNITVKLLIVWVLVLFYTTRAKWNIYYSDKNINVSFHACRAFENRTLLLPSSSIGMSRISVVFAYHICFRCSSIFSSILYKHYQWLDDGFKCLLFFHFYSYSLKNIFFFFEFFHRMNFVIQTNLTVMLITQFQFEFTKPGADQRSYQSMTHFEFVKISAISCLRPVLNDNSNDD